MFISSVSVFQFQTDPSRHAEIAGKRLTSGLAFAAFPIVAFAFLRRTNKCSEMARSVGRSRCPAAAKVSHAHNYPAECWRGLKTYAN